MPITSISFEFSSSLDIHLVRGPQDRANGDLLPFLQVTLPSGSEIPYTEYRHQHRDVEILFNPRFKPEPPPVSTETEFRGFGIRVVKKTGNVILVGGAAPANAPSNFILEAVATNVGGPAIIPAFIRVHVHKRVERIWFTPERLSVHARPGSEPSDLNYAFTVRAEFDDATVGDVTGSKELTFSPSNRMKGPYVRIPASASAGDVLDVTVKTSPAWNSRSAAGQIVVLESWESEPNVPTADLIDGKAATFAAVDPVLPDPHPVWGGAIRPEAVPNVLFVGCGFAGAAATAGFEEITNLIVHKLKTDRIVDPFGYLATAMNYWRLTPPAAKSGVSIRDEVAPLLRDGLLLAQPVPSPRTSQANVAEWSLEELIYAVGLPVMADLQLARQLDTTQPPATADDLRRLRFEAFNFTDVYKKWNAVAQPVQGAANFDTVSPSLVHRWLGLADRTFIDEVDNFPPLSIGRPPGQGQTNRFAFHPLRGTSAEREAFFRRVTATPRGGVGSIALDGPPPGNALGHLWVIDPDDENPAARRNFTFDNRRFLTLFSNIPYGQIDSGIHMRHQQTAIGASGERSTIHGIPVARVSGRSALELALRTPSAATTQSSIWYTFAHELAHTLGLGDEYMQLNAAFTGPETELDLYANLTTPGTLLDANDKVVVKQIKWNWHRIRQASVLTGPIVRKGARLFHALVALPSRLQYSPQNVLRLRDRRPRKVIGREVPNTLEFTVQTIHDNNIDVASDKRNATIVLTTAVDVDANAVAPFGIGSLIYRPVPAPDDIRTVDRPYLTLVPPAAERIMEKIGGTMSGKLCDVNNGFVEAAPLEKDPTGKTPDTVLPVLVGVYFGGDQYACGIAHPAAGCLMRTSGSSSFDEILKTLPDGIPKGVSALCPVCRYALVDFIDPEKHFLNDVDYAKWYPF